MVIENNKTTNIFNWIIKNVFSNIVNFSAFEFYLFHARKKENISVTKNYNRPVCVKLHFTSVFAVTSHINSTKSHNVDKWACSYNKC